MMSTTIKQSQSESTGSLEDVQARPDTRGVALQHAGISQLKLPFKLLQKDGNLQVVHANAKISVGLDKETKGTHMSRFVEQLAFWSKQRVLTLRFDQLLKETCQLLGSQSAQLWLDFDYFLDKAAPVTEQSAPMAYACKFNASLSTQQHYRLVMDVTIPISTLCPCSKAISEVGAHNQRAELRASLTLADSPLDAMSDHALVWLEDIIPTLEACSSCDVYPILKRADEKWVTERQYNNPKFVEDVVRDAAVLLETYPHILAFSVECEALESIHAHNAWAQYTSQH